MVSFTPYGFLITSIGKPPDGLASVANGDSLDPGQAGALTIASTAASRQFWRPAARTDV